MPDLTALLPYLYAVLTVLGAAVTALHAIAPLTKTEADNKVLAWLQKGLTLLGKVLSIVLPRK